jgi:hypothetical protein
MTAETQEPTEPTELTTGMFELLLNMTGGDVECQQPNTRTLVRRLHGAKYVNSSRWRVELSDEDMRTIDYIFQVYTLNHRAMGIRFHRYLYHRSERYRQVVGRWDA